QVLPAVGVQVGGETAGRAVGAEQETAHGRHLQTRHGAAARSGVAHLDGVYRAEVSARRVETGDGLDGPAAVVASRAESERVRRPAAAGRDADRNIGMELRDLDGARELRAGRDSGARRLR